MKLMEKIESEVNGLMNSLENDFKKSTVKFNIEEMFEVV